ncbi:MAG TPA: preprotein translocase subunit SecG [Saprospiraceae bacterium]|nr:preprotein translocase subunit SecG [Saprospiraceae bacterium]
MLTFLVIITAIVCLLLMLVVLIQNPKGGGVDSTFGGNATNQLFGASRSVDFIEKLTWYLAGTLFLLCIITAIYVQSSTDASGVKLLTQ